MTNSERLQQVQKQVAERCRPPAGKGFVDLDKPHDPAELGNKSRPVKAYIGVSDGEEHDGHD